MHSTTGAELQQFQALEAEVQMCMEQFLLVCVKLEQLLLFFNS